MRVDTECRCIGGCEIGESVAREDVFEVALSVVKGRSIWSSQINAVLAMEGLASIA